MTQPSRAEQALQHASDGVIWIAPDGMIRSVNEAAARILRAQASEISGRPLARILDEMNGFILDAVRETTDQQRFEGMELYVPVTDEWVPINLTVLPGADGTMLVLEDLQLERDLRRALSRYVSDTVIDGVLSGASGNGAIQPATILFSDIRGFSRLSETVGPTATVALLNEYFSYMEDVVANRSGVIDKYIGDAVMAVFGIPVAAEADPDNAMQAAADMLQALAMLNTNRARLHQPHLRIGIGLATGPVLVGNIGSPKRMDFTAIGEPVNQASRLESATKLYGADILCCGVTAAALRPGRRLRRLDVVRLAGQDRPIEVFELIDHRVPEWGDRLEEAMTTYADGLVYAEAGEWALALAAFEAAGLFNPDDKAATILAERCRQSLRNPPEVWDGAFTLIEK